MTTQDTARSLAQRLVDELRGQILSGALPPGEVLVEPRLAEGYGVSKTPVREALHLLATEGLVAVLPKKGYLVRTMAPQDLAEVLDLRMLLEPHAAGEAARHANAALLGSLRDALDRQREVSPTDPIEGMREARRFHETLASGARNSRLADALHRCFNETSRAHHILPGLREHMTDAVELDEHEAVYSAVASGDAAAAEDAMRAHLRTIHATVTRQFARGSGLWDGAR